jgi:hypothetical protein
MAVSSLARITPERCPARIYNTILTGIRVDYMAHLKQIEKYSYAYVELPVDNVYDCLFKVAEYELVRQGSYPLRRLLQTVTIPVNRQWLSQWEVLSRLPIKGRLQRVMCDDAVRDVISKHSPACVFTDSKPQLYFSVGWRSATVPRGCIICIEIGHVSTTAQLAAIAQLPATKLRLIHCSADDRVYLTGISAGGEIPEIGPEPNITEVTPESMEPLERGIISMMGALYTWRSEYYENLLGKLSMLDVSQAAKDFDDWMDNFITASFPDVSAEWVDATDFPFCEWGSK